MKAQVCFVIGALCAVSVVHADDTVIVLNKGADPNAVVGPSTVLATWNGAGYDDIRVMTWLRDVGATSDFERWHGYQIALDDAVPTPGCTGNVTKIYGTMTIDTSRPDWMHFGYSAQHAIAHAPDYAALVMSSYLGSRDVPLGDEALYLCEIDYTIASGTTGAWLVPLRCPHGQDCLSALNCAQSYQPCNHDSDCPRYAILGETEDECRTGISLDDDTFFLPTHSYSRTAHDVFPLTIEIPTGQCCDGETCLGIMTPEDCAAAPNGVWTYGRDCSDPCPGCGNGLLDVGESCDDGNNLPLDGCSVGCKLEAPVPFPAVTGWGLAAMVLTLGVGVMRANRR